MQTDAQEVIQNSKIADSSGKIIFENNILCSQFLRDYIELPYLKDVQPEDIEDVSDQFVPLFSEERNADRVKKVRIKKEHPFFVVSLIEHKSTVDYDVSMQIFRYMVYIWEAYAKEAERLHKGVTKLADFRYPPILPIVYYEGTRKWTVPFAFRSRIIEGDAFKQYIPDFEYYLVPLRQYSNEELLAKKDEISLVMLINRMRNEDDIEAFRKLPVEKVEEILKETPGHLLDIISNILRAFLLKMKLPEEATEELVGKVKEKKMGYLFEDMTLDIQEIRREALKARQEADEARKEADEARQEADEARKEAANQVDEIKEKTIQIVIETCKELGVSKDDTIDKLVERYGIEKEEASEKADLFWK